MDTLFPMTPLESWLLLTAIIGLVSSFVYYLRWKALQDLAERQERNAWKRLADRELSRQWEGNVRQHRS